MTKPIPQKMSEESLLLFGKLYAVAFAERTVAQLDLKAAEDRRLEAVAKAELAEKSFKREMDEHPAENPSTVKSAIAHARAAVTQRGAESAAESARQALVAAEDRVTSTFDNLTKAVSV